MQDHSGGHGVPDSGAVRDTPADVAAEPLLRLANLARSCGRCGAKAAAEDTFCTSCGSTLADAGDGATADTAVGASSVAVERTLVASPPLAAEVSAPARRSWLVPALAVAAGLLLAAAVVLAVFWRDEARHASRVQQRLDATRSTLQQTRSSLASTRAKLRATSALSAKRRAVLVQAQTVLARVDPLLSSVDGVQQRAGDLQSQGTTMSTDAESLIQTTITLVNYLVDWGSSADVSYVNGLIDQANSELESVRADEVLFGGDTTTYSKASATFGQKADAFSSAVRSLQTQLKGAAGS